MKHEDECHDSPFKQKEDSKFKRIRAKVKCVMTKEADRHVRARTRTVRPMYDQDSNTSLETETESGSNQDEEDEDWVDDMTRSNREAGEKDADIQNGQLCRIAEET